MIVALLLPTIAYQITDYKIHEWLALQELLQREHVIYKMLIKQGRKFSALFLPFFASKPQHIVVMLYFCPSDHYSSSLLYTQRALSGQKRCRTPLVSPWRRGIFQKQSPRQTNFLCFGACFCFTIQANCKQ